MNWFAALSPVARTPTPAERIGELAKQHGSIRAAARALDVDYSYLHRIALGKRTSPGKKVLRKLGLP